MHRIKSPSPRCPPEATQTTTAKHGLYKDLSVVQCYVHCCSFFICCVWSNLNVFTTLNVNEENIQNCKRTKHYKCQMSMRNFIINPRHQGLTRGLIESHRAIEPSSHRASQPSSHRAIEPSSHRASQPASQPTRHGTRRCGD